MSERTGPVIMGHPVAREQLETHGAVLSFRTSDRTTGETHYRYERTGGKQGDVTIEKESEHLSASDPELVAYYPMSGFDTLEAWRDAIEEVHGDREASGYVYRIEIDD